MTTPTAQFPSARQPFLNPDGTVARVWLQFLESLVRANAYTPTITKVTNLDAVTAYVCQYMQALNEVMVVGKLDADPTAAGAVRLGISLPVDSTFTLATDCGGVAAASGVAGQSAGIYADTTNARAQMEWVTVDTANRTMYFMFQYQVR